MTLMHLWIANGQIFTTSSKEHKPYKDKPKIKVKYMGTTELKKGWPKKLSTGRILYGPKKLV